MARETSEPTTMYSIAFLTDFLPSPTVKAALSAAAGVALAGAILLTLNGVTAQPLLLLAAFEALFVLLPGFVAYRLLWREEARLSRQLTFSVALGYAVQALAYMAAAAVGSRSLFLLLPVVSFAALAAVPRRVTRDPQPVGAAPAPIGAAIALGGICVIALGYLWVIYFLDNPLPGTVAVVSYYVDAVHDISLIAEAMHHWPIGDPHVHGESFAYYTLPFVHIASLADITGAGAPVAFFRLYLVPVFVMLAVQTYYLGTIVGGGSRTAGLLAAGCALLVGELDLSAASIYPFYNTFFFGLIYSPTFALGALLFIPIVAEIAIRRERWHVGHAAGMTLLFFCAATTKAHIIPLALCGLAGSLAWTALRERKVDWYLAMLTLVAATLFAGVYGFGQARATSVVYSPLLRAPRITNLPMPLPVIIGLAGMLGIRFVGLLAAVPSMWHSPSGPVTRIVFTIVAGIGATALLDMGSAEFYFLWFVYFLLSALAARVTAQVWQARPRIAVAGRWLVAALLLIGLFDLPLDYVNRLWQWSSGQTVYNTAGRYLTRDLWAGLTWTRDNLPPDAVVAVNNVMLRPGDARYFYYSAFSERHAFMEGFMYSDRTHAVGYAKAALGQVHPFPERRVLVESAFSTGDAEALIALRARGVTHLLVDNVHGMVPPRLDRMAVPVFANTDVAIYALR
jgi:hypothetical protein